MRQPRRLCILFSLLMLVAPALLAAGTLTVNESTTRSELRDGAITIHLAVENASGHRLPAHIEAELLDPDNKSHGRAALDHELPAGSSKVALEIALPKLKPDEIFQDRLVYKLSPPTVDSPPFERITGIIAVSEISPADFELQAAYPGAIEAGSRIHVLIRAVQLHTSRPVSGVKIHAALGDDDADSDESLKASTVTNSRGYATVAFNVPVEADGENAELHITGELAGYTATLSVDNSALHHYSKFLLSTDKPLYQPGQTIHTRVLTFGPDHRAFANQPIDLEILDPDENLVYKTSVTTSPFGVASADWSIPANQPLGAYRVTVSFDGDDNQSVGGATSVKISRYELPNFSVKVKPDRDFYLPGQNAEVAVRADYLFGQPVARGHVRVAREDSRTWNFHDQKWEIEEGQVFEGDTDANGAFVAKIDLGDAHKDLGDRDYERFTDIRYTAYFTDPSSARTEQRRFDLRVTKDSIHVYIISDGRVAVDHWLNFYLSTFHADGTPAACDVTIEDADSASDAAKAGHPAPILRKIHTNRYGLAKIENLAVDLDRDYGETLTFLASDSQGATGVHSQDFTDYDSAQIRVVTDKVFYRPDDPIQVSLTADDPEATLEVEATSNLRFLTSQIVRLHHGRASLAFDPNEKFQGAITISANELGRRPGRRFGQTDATGYHTVLFPHDTSLQLDVHLSKATYKPGESAQADFRVSSADGDSSKSALGLVVVDKAVEERRRTDQDLDGQSGFFGFLFGQDLPNFGGLRREDLDKVDLSKPLPPGFELAAEILLQDGYFQNFFETSDSEPNLRTLFGGLIDPPLAPILKAIDDQAKLPKSPVGESGIRRFLDSTALAGLRDPWGTPYRVRIEPMQRVYEIELVSAGPDKKFDTDDDLSIASRGWPYFTEYDAAIGRAAIAYHARTGSFIRDLNTLRSELRAVAVDLDSLRDPWGHAYRIDFGIERDDYTITVTSPGADGKFDAPDAQSADDVVVSRNAIDYFEGLRVKIDNALARRYQDSRDFPQTEKDLADVLGSAGIDWNSMRDPWGNRYYATFHQEAQYSDDVVVQSYDEYQAGQKITITPRTVQMNFIRIRSNGPDLKSGTQDDFTAAVYSRAAYAAPPPRVSGASTVFSGALGAISGTVTDPAGGAVGDAQVIATREGTQESYEAKSERDGSYTVRNVRPGIYEVRIASPGFKDRVFTAVPVASSAVTRLDATLSVGTTTQTVTVEAEASVVQTETATVVGKAIEESTKFSQGKSPSAPVSTPRLREYFPETLLWQPELITDSRGNAHLKFPLADSITTWQLSAVASTLDGRIATAEKDLRAFQPFFADQDLPQFLTAGDEIGLPVILRNFLDQPESVNVNLAPQPWLKLLGPATEHAEVAPNDSARAIFPIRAETPVKEGKQRVTATGKSASDAIEKKTTVRPFGEEKTLSESQILKSSATLNVSIPQNALPGSFESELKIYPNLMAHVWESIEAILDRPYGCGEQTISSTYPSVLLLQYAKQTGHENSPQVAKARKYAQMGYDRLLSLQGADGGFTYWGRKGDAGDIAVTAYALMFLHDAKQVLPVDDDVVAAAQKWLLAQQKPDGRWPSHYYWSNVENVQSSAALTAYVARVLALTAPRATGDAAQKKLAEQYQREYSLALAWLAPRTEQQDDPYLIASYALALLLSPDRPDTPSARRPLERLRSIVHAEGDTDYWELEMNTPFYGWGRAGRMETTALVVEAFERASPRGIDAPNAEADASLISRATLYLLKNQDRYGIWYSTQATINVLRALAASVAPASAAAPAGNSATSVLVDGKPAATITLPPANALSAPIAVDLAKFVSPGEHHVEIRRAQGLPDASVQLATQFYVPWSSAADVKQDESTLHQKNSAESLRLSVEYDRKTSKIGEKITCSVKAERLDYRGFGMMLAEIGLPPGAEVDRDTLDKAMSDSGWEINQFDILPDRVIVYLWPRAGGTAFHFAFTTRFAINAETTPSTLYDYYNPDAQAKVEPTRIVAQ